MKKLKNIETVVETVLSTKEEARKNDDILYLYVCEHFNPNVSSMTLKDFLMIRNNTSYPNFASVTRARRKVFEKHPELKPAEATKRRKEMQEVYVDYAING